MSCVNAGLGVMLKCAWSEEIFVMGEIVTAYCSILNRLFRVSFYDDDEYAVPIMERGRYSDSIFLALMALVDTDAICLDIGANIGFITLALTLLAPRGRVYSFEPNPRAYECLVRNLEQNHLCNVSVHNMAVSSRTEPLLYHEHSDGTAWGITTASSGHTDLGAHYSRALEVQATSLDDWLAREALDRIDVIKIDVEGGDLEVLKGARGVLEKHRPVVVLEFNSRCIRSFLKISPEEYCREIFGMFEQIDLINPETGILQHLGKSPADWQALLSENESHGSVTNLVGSFRGSVLLAKEEYFRRLEPNELICHLETAIAEKNAVIGERDALRAERDTMVNSRIWRYTVPVRWLSEAIRRLRKRRSG